MLKKELLLPYSERLPMFRLVLPLCAAMFVALLIAGRDNGQMRPGLARAVASGEEIVMIERQYSPTVVAADAPAPVKVSATDLPPPVEIRDAPAVASVPREETLPAELAPKPVFTLSALSGLNGDQASLENATDPAAEDTAPAASESLYADPSDGGALSPDPSAAYDSPSYDSPSYDSPSYDGLSNDGPAMNGDIRTVSASSVNVRLGPSTDSSVVGRLSEGEAVRVIGAFDSEWVEVAIEGDGISGYVASRFLSNAY